MDELIIMIIAAVVVFAAIRAIWRPRRQGMDDFPYGMQKHFLSPAELNFFQTLLRAVDHHVIVCPKVGMGDIFSVELADKSRFRTYRNKIDRKHVDFLLCDPATMQPLMGIELDDKSHRHPDRQRRDAFVDRVFEAAGLPLLHVPVRRAYNSQDIREYIAPYLYVSVTPVTAARPVPVTTSQPVTPPLQTEQVCPKCGSQMVLRTAKKGASAGQQFWGCSNYPTCRTMLPLKSPL